MLPHTARIGIIWKRALARDPPMKGSGPETVSDDTILTRDIQPQLEAVSFSETDGPSLASTHELIRATVNCDREERSKEFPSRVGHLAASEDIDGNDLVANHNDPKDELVGSFVALVTKALLSDESPGPAADQLENMEPHF